MHTAYVFELFYKSLDIFRWASLRVETTDYESVKNQN
jgi:hypothetical protein